MRQTLSTILCVLGLAGSLAACGGGSSLTTGSLIGGPSGQQADKPVTPSDRALLVGSTIARAQRCGFIFEPEQLRANYLASEQQAGTPPDVMQRVTKELDYTRQSVLAGAAKDDGYCTEGRTRETKSALNRQLAGDFNPPQRRKELNIGWYEHQKPDRGLDGNKVFDASQRKAGPVGDQ